MLIFSPFIDISQVYLRKRKDSAKVLGGGGEGGGGEGERDMRREGIVKNV